MTTNHTTSRRKPRNIPPGRCDEIIAELRAEREAMAKQEPRAWMWRYIGSDPIGHQIEPCARSFHEMDPSNPPYPESWKPEYPLFAFHVPLPEGWQPIETAPKDGSDVIVMYMHIDTQIVHNAFWLECEGVEPEEIGWWSYEHSEVSRIKLDGWMTPTHWMPLPPAPQPT